MAISALPLMPPRVDCTVRVHTIVPDQPDQEVTHIEYPINEFLSDENEIPPGDESFRWIHVPANNLAWVEKCFQKFGRPNPRIWTRKMRAGLSRHAGRPLHARHMEASCDGTDPSTRQLALFLPYLNWDTFGNYKALRGVYDCWKKDSELAKLPPPASARATLERALFPYLSLKESLHPRRSLDQFYYSSLEDTTSRDRDQTISKWTGTKPLSARAPAGNAGEGDPGPDGRDAAVDDSLLVMIDQLWCWVVDDKTVLSFFPSQAFQYKATGFVDLYQSILKKAGKCKDVCDFFALVARKATNYFFNENDRNFEDVIELYRWVVNKKAAHQMACFEQFHQEYANGNTGAVVIDDRRELKLVLGIADIIDELNMLQYLFKQQRDVLQSLIQLLKDHKPAPRQDRPEIVQSVNISKIIVNDQADVNFFMQNHPDLSYEIENTRALAKGIDGLARDHVVSTDEKLLSLRAEVDAISKNAEYVHQRLLALLDLKSKTASLLEARSSTQQGRAVMLFTIVTIIFLPLSFFTSYFGQNVSEITGDSKNPTSWELWRIATPITVVVVVLALIIAYYIGKPNSRVWGRGRRGVDVERQ